MGALVRMHRRVDSQVPHDNQRSGLTGRTLDVDVAEPLDNTVRLAVLYASQYRQFPNCAREGEGRRIVLDPSVTVQDIR